MHDTRAPKHWRTVAAITGVLALALVGCGGDDTDAEAEPPAESPTEGETQATDDGAPGETAEEANVDWAEVEAAARAEGQLVFYTSTHDSINVPEIEAFNEEYPDIQVSHVRLNTNQLTTRFSSETEAGAQSADLLKMSDALLLQDKPEWFVPMDETVVPNLVELDPTFVHETFYEIIAGPYVFTYNKDLIDSAPSDYCELTDPKYDGKVMLNTPSPGSGWAAWVEIRETCGDEFLEAIADRMDSGSFKWYGSAATAQQELAAGEAAIIGHGQASHSADLREQGAPLDYVYLSDPPLALAHRIAIPADAANPNAARLYANWLLTRDGQEAACQGLYNSLIFEDIENCPKVDAANVLFTDTEKGAAQGEEIMSLLRWSEGS